MNNPIKNEQIPYQRRYTDDKKAHEKTFNFMSLGRTAN